MKHVIILTSLLFFSKFSFAGSSEKDPRIIACPAPYKGEVTVIYRDNYKKRPWFPMKWSCIYAGRVASSMLLEEKINENPPNLQDPVRIWEEGCPRGTYGMIRYIGNENEYRPENWTCSMDGNRRLDWALLKGMIARENAAPVKASDNDVAGATGVNQVRTCPMPYQGTYTARFMAPRWIVSRSMCNAPGAKTFVSEDSLQKLLDISANPVDPSLPQ